MQRSPSRSLTWLAVPVVFVVGIYVVWIFATERQRSAKLAQVKKPATIEAYEELVDELYGTGSTVPILQPGTQADAGEFAGFPEDWEYILEGYRYLFGLLQAREVAMDAETVDILRKEFHDRTDAEQSKVADYLRANQDFVQEIRNMAERGGPVYPLDFSKGLEIELPHLASLRQCARLLREDAIAKAAAGNYTEAVEDVIAGMKLGDALAQESILLPQLVRIAIYWIMNAAVEDAFDEGKLSPELARAIIARVAEADNRQAFAESMAGERHMGLMLFSEIRTGLSDSVSSFAGEMAFERFYGNPVARPILNRDEAAYADIMNRTVVAALLTYHEAAPALERIEVDIQNLARTCVLSSMLLPALARACQAQARHEALLDLMQIGLLVEQYKARKGSYPATLDAIAADLGGSLPVDPFTGEGYRYKLSGDSFLLYSVGQNCVDDGGAHDPMNGDIVWRGEQRP